MSMAVSVVTMLYIGNGRAIRAGESETKSVCRLAHVLYTFTSSHFPPNISVARIYMQTSSHRILYILRTKTHLYSEYRRAGTTTVNVALIRLIQTKIESHITRTILFSSLSFVCASIYCYTACCKWKPTKQSQFVCLISKPRRSRKKNPNANKMETVFSATVFCETPNKITR